MADNQLALYHRNRTVVVALVAALLHQYEHSIPAGVATVYTNRKKGDNFTKELLEPANSIRLRRYTRFSLIEFNELYSMVHIHLKAGRIITREQKLIMFLHTMACDDHYRDISEDFNHTPETVGLCFHEVLHAVCRIYEQLVIPAEPGDCKGIRNRSDRTKYWPFFDRAVGALDGSHIDAHVPMEDQAAHRNRKGALTQNVLAVVDWNMKFTFILPGWEGSAHDGRVLANARSAHGFGAPEGYYYLADAGYSNQLPCLVPYRGVRYHLREQYLASQKPETPKELFNLRHSSLRNIVERAFGVFKRTFRIFDTAPQFPDMSVQVALVYAGAALHNLLRELRAPIPGAHVEVEDATNNVPEPDLAAEMREDAEVKGPMDRMRDSIAAMLWKQYEEVREDDEESEEY